MRHDQETVVERPMDAMLASTSQVRSHGNLLRSPGVLNPRNPAWSQPLGGRRSRSAGKDRSMMRRSALRSLSALTLLAAVPWLRARSNGYPTTAAAMRSAQEVEMGVYYRYTEFGRKARQEGYLGIAYLFVAFGSAEFIHASNFGRIFARLNVEVAPIQKPEFKVGSTRENLLVAANTFLGSVQPSCGRRYRVLGPDKPSSGAHGAQRRTCWTTRCCTGGLRSPTRERSRPLSTFGRGPSKAWVHLTLSPSSRCHRALQPVEWAWLAGNPLRSKS